MKCTSYDIRDETGRSVGGAIVCGPKQRAKRCSNCDADATRLCDAPLRGKKVGKTCDAPLCVRCAMRLPGVDGDLCPAHARTMTSDEVDAVRAARAAAATDAPRENVITIKSDEQRAADAWLEELVNDPNEVDRDALAAMFPTFAFDSFDVHELGWDDSRAPRAHVVGGAAVEREEDLPGSWHQQQNGGERVSYAAHGEVCPRDVPPADATEGQRRDTRDGSRPFANADEAARYICRTFGIDERELDDIPFPDDLPDVAALAEAVAQRGADVVAGELAARGVRTSIADKARHVRRATQTRTHACHWPGCPLQVPPAMWGCKSHWCSLPKELRDKIWRAYRPGQENDMRPSRAYLEVADEVQAWIARNADEDIPF